MHLKVKALNELESRLNIYKRYEDQLQNAQSARFTTKEAHDAAYKGSKATLLKIESRQLYDTVEIYDDKSLIYSCDRADKRTRITDTVINARLAAFSPEKSTAYIKAAEQLMQSMKTRGEKPEYINDVKSLQDNAKEKSLQLQKKKDRSIAD